MIQFAKLRLSGFKSFVDKTELDIGPGLNGIVGPNGCGKSNLVEALRWVMGEGSARKMRGDGMEDVIFSGTSNRASRNIAEVSLLLDNSHRKAPAAYNGQDEIEITRKIERDHGSSYKINGKTVRARDVQILLADTMTGASSPALVSQGRITQIITAKPLERRMILEESAGISGLYARRHEAETRLKAADANLQRVTDLTGGMDGRLANLKRQARQASRYRNLSAQIRQLDILISWLEWRGLEEKRKGQEQAFSAAESIVAEKMISVTQLAKTQLTQAEELPALRKVEAEAAAVLQTKKMALVKLEEDEARLKAALEETANQLAQTAKDKDHEAQSQTEASAALEKILEEQKFLQAQEGTDSERLTKLESEKQKLEEKVKVLEGDYTALMQAAAESKAMSAALSGQIERAESRLKTLADQKAQAETQKAEALAASSIKAQEQEAIKQTESLKAAIEKLQAQKTKLAEKLEGMDESIKSARTAHEEAQNKRASFEAELALLEKLLAGAEDEEFTPILHSLKTEEGFEKALSRALGDSLLAALDERASSFWRPVSIKNLPALPQGLAALLPKIKAEAILHPALSQIGFVETTESAEAFLDKLLPGQAIVSVEGDYWRWDGLCIKAEAQDSNARHLEQKNRLDTLRAGHKAIESSAEKASAALEKTLADQKTAKEELDTLARNISEQDRALHESERALSKLREEAIKQAGALERLDDTITRSAAEMAELETRLKADQKSLKEAEAKNGASEQDKADTLRGHLTEARETYQDALRAYERFAQEQSSRRARLQAIGDERINLQNRVIRSKEQLKGYETRLDELKIKAEELKARPARSEEEKQTLLNAIAAAEKTRGEAAESLARVEGEVAETTKALKEAEAILGEAREARAGAQATLSALKEQAEGLAESIAEKFDLKPQELSSHISQDPEQLTLDKLPGFKQERETLGRERDAIGPVNLRAEEEVQSLEGEMVDLLKEHTELTQAAQELRGAIQKINKEARERLLHAFEQINIHFQSLFTRLFQGGQASLSLIDSEDPLGAGLEIFAQPPGKSLQSLSLLSGGEQTMTAIALIFAMFLTNPSPICVLDEIDAPLDDSNVDRVCDLLDEIAERGQTRFLIITHHRLSMARMDRLYGVTMAEKGISQLVSVDLQQSFDFVKEAA